MAAGTLTHLERLLFFYPLRPGHCNWTSNNLFSSPQGECPSEGAHEMPFASGPKAHSPVMPNASEVLWLKLFVSSCCGVARTDSSDSQEECYPYDSVRLTQDLHMLHNDSSNNHSVTKMFASFNKKPVRKRGPLPPSAHPCLLCRRVSNVSGGSAEQAHRADEKGAHTEPAWAPGYCRFHRCHYQVETPINSTSAICMLLALAASRTEVNINW